MIWRITKKLNGKTYYYVGLENRGRRVWSVNHHAAANWEEKEDAIKAWNDELNGVGSITGDDTDEVALAWLTGNGWSI